MNSKHCRFLLAATPLWALGALSTFGGPKPDLERIRPVPADQPVPLADFYRPVLMQPPSMNLAGSHIAAPILTGQDHTSLLVYDVGARKPEIAAVPAARDVRDVWWAGDQHVLYTLLARKLYDTAILVSEVGKTTQSNPIIQSGGGRVVRIPEAKPLEPLIWLSRDNETGRDAGVAVVNATTYTGGLIDLFSVNTTGTDYANAKDWNIKHTLQNLPIPGGGLTTRYICDKDDALAFAVTSLDGVETLQRFTGHGWEKCPVNLDEIEIVDAGNAPGELVVLGPRQPDKPRALQFMDAATGKLGEVLLQDPEYDFNGVLYRDRVSHKIVGLRYQRNGPRTVWFVEQFLVIQKALDAQFPGQIVAILDWNRAATRFVIGRYTDRQPIAYDWVDLEAKSAGLINQSRPWIEPARMQPVQMFKFKTKDGRKLDAYLTLPKGASAQAPVPLVVLLRNEPNGRAEWSFDADAQYFASRGYAVLKPNFRGARGYNWAFPHEDEWDYLKMHEDVTAATNTVIRTKLVDRSRIAIMGTGFGGYLATCGVANEPELYRCAVTIDGIYDWAARVAESRYSQGDNPYYGWLIRRLGDPTANKARYDAISPLRRADQIKAAMFVAYGKGTSPVEVGQPHALLSALDRNHVPHESMLVNDDVHGFVYLDTQLELREKIESFLSKNFAPMR
jgi:dienelactone hydrolase